MPPEQAAPDGLWRAPAKVNLTLHILGRRADGYHELESLVAFAGLCDGLSFQPGAALSLDVSGPTAGAAGADDDNLVLRAARALAERAPGIRLGRFGLFKSLPVAAGLGGGSSDAAAALRALADANGMAGDDERLREAARATGADVLVCLDPCARIMSGIGDIVGPPLGLPPLPAVLVNPGVAVPTPQVFAGLGLARGAKTGAVVPDAASSIREGRNDLQASAEALAPEITRTLAALEQTAGVRVARMSGSGATCFGLFDDRRSAALAARALRRDHPGWWVRATMLR